MEISTSRIHLWAFFGDFDWGASSAFEQFDLHTSVIYGLSTTPSQCHEASATFYNHCKVYTYPVIAEIENFAVVGPPPELRHFAERKTGFRDPGLT